MNRYLVIYQTRDGDCIGKPRYVTANAITLALHQLGEPHDHRIHSALVFEDCHGVRVPLWHTAPKWAPSSDWSDVG